MMLRLHVLLIVCFALCGVTGQEDLVEIIAEPTVCAGDIDLIILVDGSYSVTAANFGIVKEWIKDIARGFDIGAGNVQIGVVQYSYWYSTRPMWRQKYIKTEIPLGEYTDQESFNKAVDGIRYQGYRTFTAHAINKTVDYDFQGERNRYPEAQRAIILLTDGKATDAADLPLAIRHAEQAHGVVIFAVGVGDYSLEELRLITNGDRERIFELKNFDELATIVYELPQTLQRACDCDQDGSEGNDCDPCTRECVCKPNVVGRRCDKCAPGTYGLLGAGGCKACHCNQNGTLEGNTCNQENGDCQCLPDSGISGKRCDRCEPAMFGFPECKPCQCNGFSASCSADLGICDECRSNRAGIHCETCRSGYYMTGNGECQPCQCNGHIDTEDVEACDPNTGECLRCLHGTTGPQCLDCAKFYYRNESTGNCRECQCHINGTELSSCEDDKCSCDPISGRCTCHGNVIGDFCDTCDDGFWNLNGGNGCEACGCHGSGSASQVCNKETGQCVCLPGHTGLKCEQCKRGHSRVNDDDLCLSCDCNLSGSVRESCERGVCACDPIKGQCPCLPNVEGLSCDKCLESFWDFGAEQGCKECSCHSSGSFSPNCDKKTGECECLPGNIGIKCKDCDLGYYKENPQSQCKACRCNLLGTNSSACVGDVCSCNPETGQCPCLPNVVGLACDKCDDGFWDLGAKEGCKSCSCENKGCVSPVCNKNTGACDCLPGHTGPKCEECEVGYFRQDPDELCKECNCNMYGRNDSSCEDGICACAPVTGQCNCLPNVTGFSCDLCLDGYWDLGSMRGCKPCGCHEQGSASEVCEKKTGQCECMFAHTGQRCEDCEKGYWKTHFEGRCGPDVLNDEPSPPDPPKDEENTTVAQPKTSSISTTTTTPTTTTTTATTTKTTTTTRTTTRRLYTARTFRPRPLPTAPSYIVRTTTYSGRRLGCNRCYSWPSYCYGWMCRRRWPYQYFAPAAKRCNYGHTTCQHNVERGRQVYGRGYGSYTNGVITATPPKRRPSPRQFYGYRMYSGSSNYYKPYSRPRSHTHARISSRSSSSRSSSPMSYGLYRSLYGKKK